MMSWLGTNETNEAKHTRNVKNPKFPNSKVVTNFWLKKAILLICTRSIGP